MFELGAAGQFSCFPDVEGTDKIVDTRRQSGSGDAEVAVTDASVDPMRHEFSPFPTIVMLIIFVAVCFHHSELLSALAGAGTRFILARRLSAKLRYTDTGYGQVVPVQHHQRMSSQQFYNLL